MVLRRLRLQLGADLIDDNHLRHVVLHRLDHHPMLLGGPRHLHAAGPPNAGMRHVAVPRDLIGRIHHHHPLAQLVGRHPRRLSQQRRLAHAGPAQDQERASGFDDILDQGRRASDRASDPAGEADDLASLFLMALMRCSVRPIPARLSSPNRPIRSTTYARSSLVTASVLSVASDPEKARLRFPPEVHDNLE